MVIFLSSYSKKTPIAKVGDELHQLPTCQGTLIISSKKV